jgi:aminoglycoside phosphotransferase (APT) family kinase protein
VKHVRTVCYACAVAEEDELRGIVERAFPGCRVNRKERLNGGISARATLLELTLGDGTTRPVVVRRPTRDTRADALRAVEREHALLSRCAELGIVAPRPWFLDPDAVAIVLEFIDGAPDFAPVRPRDMLEQLATQLALIHTVPLDEALRFVERNDERAQERAAHTPQQPDISLNEAHIRSLVRELWPWPQHNPDALLHGDYWPGNVVWKDGKLAAVLDWEEAAIGDPLADVALSRLDIAWAFGDDAAQTFTACYREQTRIDWQNLARWDLSIALRPMGSLSRWALAYAGPPISRPDIDEASMRAGHQRFVARAIAALRAGSG